MKVSEIKELLRKQGITDDDMKGKKKPDLEKMIVQDGTKQENEIVPDITSPQWSSYVLSKLTPDELTNGAPRCDGLRRVTELLLGRIISSNTHVVEAPRIDNGMRGTVVVTLCIKCLGQEIYVDGAADVYTGNSGHPFGLHPVATAETRAEARALRRALRLVKVQSAEELDGPSVDEPNGVDRISSGMRAGINQMCDQSDIDPDKLSEILFTKKFEELSPEDGQKLVEVLKKYKQGTEEIPASVLKG